MNRQIELYSGNSMQNQYGQGLGGQGLGGQGLGGSNMLLQCYGYCQSSPRLPRDFELVIEKVGSEIVLDYGAKLRLLMADPFAGIDLREAIAKLKEALKIAG
jgi:hypothetical protein